ncbi:DUF2513 domain-containing protein [Colwellia asteriadis]|uniref:DUF2513 domain-containing protein n=1 Tax=Colwellia asteriadis TaxID=517723 RepID=A0ABN1L8C6_9GAMM
MRIDYEYVEQILEVFLESNSPTVDWNSFLPIIRGNDDKFIFHILILVDKNLIVAAHSDGLIGIKRNYTEYVTSVVPWRLTSDGHDFANALVKPGVLATVQEKFKEEGLSAVIGITKKIVEKQAMKLLDE